MTLSVIITYYNQNLDVLREHIQFCYKSEFPINEIIVVNDGSSIDCLPTLKELKQSVKIIYAKIKEDIKWNQPGARNLGLFISTSDYISVEDLDCFPNSDYYKVGINALIDKNAIRFHSNAVILAKNGKFDYNPGNGIFLRSSLVAAGGWDEDYSGNYGYDDIWLNCILTTRFGDPVITQEKLVSFISSGETQNTTRDFNHNKKLIDKMLISNRSKSILRFHYDITQI